MAKNRVVTFADTDPTHTTFDMMRTKVLRAMRRGRLDLARDHLADRRTAARPRWR